MGSGTGCSCTTTTRWGNRGRGRHSGWGVFEAEKDGREGWGNGETGGSGRGFGAPKGPLRDMPTHGGPKGWEMGDGGRGRTGGEGGVGGMKKVERRFVGLQGTLKSCPHP